MNTVHYLGAQLMGVTERRQREREELKALILDGAKRVFEREGHFGLSIRKVAKEIEYSPGTIYLYYKDKDELMLALHKDAFRRKAGLFAPLMDIADPNARIEAMGRAYISHALNNPSDFHLMFVDKCPMAKLRESGEEWRSGQDAFQLLVQSIQEGIDKGIFSKALSADTMAVMLWSLVHGCASLILSERLAMLDAAAKTHAIDSMFEQVNRLLES